MQRITQAKLDALAATVTRTLDNGHTYTAGQHFGLRWTLCRGTHTVLNAPTKGALYDAMHNLLEGVREAKLAETAQHPLPNRWRGLTMQHAIASLSHLPGHLVAAAQRIAHTTAPSSFVVWEDNKRGAYRVSAALPCHGMPKHAKGCAKRILNAWLDGGLCLHAPCVAEVWLTSEEGQPAA